MDMGQLVEIQVQGQEDTKAEGPKLLAQFQTRKLWKWLKPICPMPITSLTATEDSILACKKRKGTTNPLLHDLKRLFGTPQPMENEVNEVLVEATCSSTHPNEALNLENPRTWEPATCLNSPQSTTEGSSRFGFPTRNKC